MKFKLGFILFALFLSTFFGISAPSFALEGPVAKIFEGAFQSHEDEQSHMIALMNVCFNQFIDCKLLTRTQNDHTWIVVLVGESHRQTEKELLAGEQLIQHYPVVGIETAAFEAFRPGRVMGKISRWSFEAQSQFYCFYSRLSGAERGNSLILAAGRRPGVRNLEHGVAEMVGVEEYFNEFRALRKSIRSIPLFAAAHTCNYLERTMGFEPGSTALSSISATLGLAAVYNASQSASSIFLQKSNSPTIEEKRKAEFRARDSTMAVNIALAVRQEGKPMAAVMGAAHLFGVSHELVSRYQFQDHSRDLVEQFHFTKNQFPQDMESCQFRDLTQHDSSSFSPYVIETAKKIYPEVF